MGERDFIALIDGIHQPVEAPIVLVRDRLNARVSRAVREPITERARLTVFLLPAYSPDPDLVERVRAHVERSLAGTGLTLDAARHPDEPKPVTPPRPPDRRCQPAERR
jgi:transposase